MLAQSLLWKMVEGVVEYRDIELKIVNNVLFIVIRKLGHIILRVTKYNISSINTETKKDK